jgi:hypothetical protein
MYLKAKSACFFVGQVLASEEVEEPLRDEAQIDLGNGIMVNKCIVEDIKADYRHQPGIFLRKLMLKTGLFSLQELASSSLTGQKHRDGSQKPPLDPNKFLACKS